MSCVLRCCRDDPPLVSSYPTFEITVTILSGSIQFLGHSLLFCVELLMTYSHCFCLHIVADLLNRTLEINYCCYEINVNLFSVALEHKSGKKGISWPVWYTRHTDASPQHMTPTAPLLYRAAASSRLLTFLYLLGRPVLHSCTIAPTNNTESPFNIS